MTTPLKVEMVLPTLEAAGMEVMAARMARALAHPRSRCRRDVYRGRWRPRRRPRRERLPRAVVPAPGLRSNVYAPRLEAWFRSVRPDVVHVHSGVWLKAARAARRAGARHVIHTVHGLLDREPWYGPALMRLAARHTDRIAAVSDPLRDYLVNDVRVDPSKVSVIPNGVSTERFRPQSRTGALRSALCIGDDALVIGIVARLAWVKNHALLLDAFALVRERVPNAHLVIVGDGPLRKDLEAHARELGTRVIGALYRRNECPRLPSIPISINSCSRRKPKGRR